ncbi:FUSC family protein [Dyella sp. A6]|uniref:FUSC family protein n=1 Tax=Dyella aluminiiresistens TaxID=3069105 RepID=UPI002E79D829|nr:FUSC family protein [Dyella sp. A6]
MTSASLNQHSQATSGASWLTEAFAGEGRAWIFVGKSVLASCLGAWLAMWLRLEQPSTTMITVAIVMHPKSGMVLAKSFYRGIGTLAGSLCGLVLLCVFPQQRELFLLSLSLWVALCAGGAMLYRNFMAYGFVLAGYTAAIVALPVVSSPLDVFNSALMRVSEVLLGIFVAGVVSDVVVPERLRMVLRQSAREQFARFIDFARGSTGGAIPRAEMAKAHLEFVRAAVQLEDLRASVIFEDPEARARSARMRLLNQHYMAASTSFQSLHHLINRLLRNQRTSVADALIALYRPLGAALAPAPAQRHDPDVLAPRLRACVEALPVHAESLRATLTDPAAQLEFDTGDTLLRRFASELHEFTTTEIALRAGVQRGNVERAHFHRGNDHAGAVVAVLRTFLTMITLSVFWVISGWPYGASAMLLATIFSGLFAASPNPFASTFDMLIGYTAGMVCAFVAMYWMLPGSDGFVMLLAVIVPFLMIGPWLSTRPRWAGIGGGYAIGFVYLLSLKNPMVYDPVHTLNDALAQLAGVALTGVAFVFIPAVTGSGWQRMRQMRRLRGQVMLAATEPLPGLAWHFESVSRDLFQQLVAHTRPGSGDARRLLAWALAVHECGRALIELRRELQDSAVSPDLRLAVDTAVHRVARLFSQPDAVRWRSADEAVQLALQGCVEAGHGAAPLRPYLHQLRSALRDEESPMAAYQQADPMESAHAA